MEEQGVEKVICGQCGDEWLTNAEYLAHTCPKTGFNPTQAEHFGPEFLQVQKAALERGMEHVAGDAKAEAKQQTAIDEQQVAIDNAAQSQPSPTA